MISLAVEAKDLEMSMYGLLQGMKHKANRLSRVTLN